jgi:hypothetical protein
MFIDEIHHKSLRRVVVVVVGSSHVPNGVSEVVSGRNVVIWAWTLQDINGRVTKSVDIDTNYECKYGNTQICVLPSMVNKKVAAVSSTEAFLMAGLALQVEVPTAAANIPGPIVGEECWNSGLDTSIQVEAVTATSKSVWLRETLPHGITSVGPVWEPYNLGSTLATFDVQTKNYCLNSVIHTSLPPYQNHPLWCRWLDQINHIKKIQLSTFDVTERVLRFF